MGQNCIIGLTLKISDTLYGETTRFLKGIISLVFLSKGKIGSRGEKNISKEKLEFKAFVRSVRGRNPGNWTKRDGPEKKKESMTYRMREWKYVKTKFTSKESLREGLVGSRL